MALASPPRGGPGGPPPPPQSTPHPDRPPRRRRSAPPEARAGAGTAAARSLSTHSPLPRVAIPQSQCHHGWRAPHCCRHGGSPAGGSGPFLAGSSASPEPAPRQGAGAEIRCARRLPGRPTLLRRGEPLRAALAVRSSPSTAGVWLGPAVPELLWLPLFWVATAAGRGAHCVGAAVADRDPGLGVHGARPQRRGCDTCEPAPMSPFRATAPPMPPWLREHWEKSPLGFMPAGNGDTRCAAFLVGGFVAALPKSI